jgi:hypothetical protein
MRRVKEVVRRGVQYAAGAGAVTVFVLVALPYSRIAGRRRRRWGAKPRIVWGPIPIVNIRYSALADREYGYSSETLVHSVYSINTRQSYDHVFDQLASLPLVRDLVPFVTFLWAAFRYDVYGFFYDGGLLWSTPYWKIELALLRLAGKAILVYPYGSDARLPSTTRALGPWNAYTDVSPGSEDRVEHDVRARLMAFARYATVMLGCADLYEDLPRCDGIMRYAFDDRTWTPQPSPNDGIVRIVHAPNHRHYKGTRYLVEAVDLLRSEGLPVELVLIEGMPTNAARDHYARADIVADQFLIGAYALFAIEGMALGKPVVCFINDRFRPAHPEWSECPIVNANPDTLVAVLRELVLDGERRRDLGALGPSYVRKFHSLASVGADLDRWYSGMWR